MKRVTKRVVILLLLLGLAFCVTTSVKPKQAEATVGWSWWFSTPNGDIWMRSLYNDAVKIDYRVGAGGCINFVRWVPHNWQPLLADSSKGEHVDRVIQWCFWGLCDPLVASPANPETEQMYDYHEELIPYDGTVHRCGFNMNQAGSHGRDDLADPYVAGGDIFAPSMNVTFNNTTKVVEVYTVQQDNWWQIHNDNQSGKIAAYIRYEGMSYGVLKVRRVVLVPDVDGDDDDLVSPNYNPAVDATFNLGLDLWTPLLWSDDAFNAATILLESNGVPSTSSSYSFVAQFAAQNFVVGSTNGYGVAYQLDEVGMPHFAIVFGKNNALAISDQNGLPYNGTGGGIVYHTVFNSGSGTHPDNSPDKLIIIDPTLTIQECKPGVLIDQTFFIVGYHCTSPSYKNLLDNLVTNNSSALQPKVYAPNANLPGDLATIKASLIANRAVDATPTMRTEHLGNLLP